MTGRDSHLAHEPAIPYGYCECGCGEKTTVAKWTDASKGLTAGQPRRFILHHQNRPKGPRYIVEDCGYETPCWVWQLRRTPKDYPRISGALAHRVIYEEVVGPIPEGLTLDHLCRNPPCVNPAHMEPVTSTENSRRGSSAKLTLSQVQWIRDLSAMGFRGADIARFYGVSTGTVYNTVKGRQWAGT